jgi:hypothetical protein
MELPSVEPSWGFNDPLELIKGGFLEQQIPACFRRPEKLVNAGEIGKAEEMSALEHAGTTVQIVAARKTGGTDEGTKEGTKKGRNEGSKSGSGGALRNGGNALQSAGNEEKFMQDANEALRKQGPDASSPSSA